MGNLYPFYKVHPPYLQLDPIDPLYKYTWFPKPLVFNYQKNLNICIYELLIEISTLSIKIENGEEDGRERVSGKCLSGYKIDIDCSHRIEDTRMVCIGIWLY